jgi:hypothetical protein
VLICGSCECFESGMLLLRPNCDGDYVEVKRNPTDLWGSSE